MKKTKILNYFDRVAFSSLFLWVLLVFLRGFNLKPEIRINFFLFLFFSLFFVLRFKEILKFLMLVLSRINLFFGDGAKMAKKDLDNTFYLIFAFTSEVRKFIRKLPIIFKTILISFLFWSSFAVLGIFLDIFIFKFSSDLLILFLAGLWILSVRHYKFESKVSITSALMFLTICPFLLIFHWDIVAEKAAIWAYMFLVIGVGQMLFELRKTGENGHKKNKVTI